MRYGYQPDEELFLTLCERYSVLSKDHVALLTRAAEARRVGDQDVMEEVAEALDDHEAERRLLLCRIYELANPAAPARRTGAAMIAPRAAIAKARFVSYLRVSTDRQGRSGLSSQAQCEVVRAFPEGSADAIATALSREGAQKARMIDNSPSFL